MPVLHKVAVVVLLLLVAGGAALWRRKPAPAAPIQEKTPVTVSAAIPPSSSVTVAAPVADPGRLVINAFPWAQVTSVVNAEGVEQLSGTGETPLVLSLSPGAYKVSLSNPYSKRSVVLDASVATGETSRLEAELDRVDPQNYVDNLGIGQ